MDESSMLIPWHAFRGGGLSADSIDANPQLLGAMYLRKHAMECRVLADVPHGLVVPHLDDADGGDCGAVPGRGVVRGGARVAPDVVDDARAEVAWDYVGDYYVPAVEKLAPEGGAEGRQEGGRRERGREAGRGEGRQGGEGFDTGNKVSRKSVISGSQNIILGGKTVIQTDCVIRGDLRRTGGGHAVVVAIGRYCLLAQGSIIRPPYKTYKGIFSYYPMKIGDHVTIGEGSIVEAATIGSFVHIGKNCVIRSTRGTDFFYIVSAAFPRRDGRFAIVKDCCCIADNTIIPPNTVVPSFSVYEGSPGIFKDELPECAQELYESKTKDFYSKFTPRD
ncbi:trimeric LpxA-like protein [Jimgerdemannia flammicorona]|uniref:Dynactin subunit 5 n=1 Tax=Jimgerdemannia flammicorona TaxID=994334 RepID=A0A433Q677_9FUNG|nr:trimeric LpxA-like protein [Jimgerdemannia flammicorona]